MLSKLIGAVAGPALPYLLAAVAALLAALGTAVYVQTLRLDAARVTAHEATEKAKTLSADLESLRLDKQRSDQLLVEREAKRIKREAALNQTLRALRSVPHDACTDGPVPAGVDQLLKQPAHGDSPEPAGRVAGPAPGSGLDGPDVARPR